MDRPELLHRDPELLEQLARDFGDIVHERPAWVACPRSTEDVAQAVRFALAEGLPVAARGVGHSAGGQAQVEGGVVVRMASLDRLHRVDVEAGWFEADAGLTWRDLMAELLPLGVTPRVVTDWLDLSLGGTTAAGGVGSQSFRHGLQADAVEAMTVVTGSGAIVECSAEQEPELFDAVRGGLGQYGIITRVRMRIAPAPQRVWLEHLVFSDLGRFVTAVEQLMEDEVDGLLAHAVPNRPDDLARSLGVPPGTVHAEGAGNWLYDLEVTRHDDGGGEPPALGDTARRLGAVEALCRRRSYSFSELVHRIPPIVERDRREGRAPHPELAMFVPHGVARSFIGEAMDELTPDDLGGGPVLLVPFRPRIVSSPFVRLPDDDHAWLLGILRAAPTPEHVASMTRDNVALWRRGTQVGALRYPVDALPAPQGLTEWAAHFGLCWERARAAKHRYDPHGLLSPRLGIFARIE